MTPGYIIFNSEGKAFWTEMERPEGTMESAHYYEWNKSLIPVVNAHEFIAWAELNWSNVKMLSPKDATYPLPEGTTVGIVNLFSYEKQADIKSVMITIPKPEREEKGNITGFSGKEVGTWEIDPATKDLKITPHSFTEGAESFDALPEVTNLLQELAALKSENERLSKAEEEWFESNVELREEIERLKKELAFYTDKHQNQ